MPAAEVKSRKENRLGHLNNASPSTHAQSGHMVQGQTSTTPMVNDHIETRKVSQSVFGLIGGGMSMGTVPVEQQPTAVTPSMSHSVNEIVPRSGSLSAEQSSKRMRNFTPASSRVIDEEDEPRRSSPRVRISAVETAENQN
jgi:hypothetical protein